MKKILPVILSVLMSSLLILSGCGEPEYTTVTDTQTETTTDTSTITKIDTTTVKETSTIITTIQNMSPPIVSVSNHDYSMGDAVGFMYDTGDSTIWMNSVELGAISNRQSFIDSAVAKAEELQLNSENLQDILTKLVLNIDQLDFTGKNISEDGEGVYPFRLSSQTVHLPYWIEKAEYKGQEAWIVSLNWNTAILLTPL